MEHFVGNHIMCITTVGILSLSHLSPPLSLYPIIIGF